MLYKKNKLRRLCFFISFFLCLGVSPIVNADHTYKTSIVKKILPAVVEVHAEKSNNSGVKKRGGFKFRNKNPQMDRFDNRPNPRQEKEHLGSGFVISPDGYILTNAHVVNNIFQAGGKIRIIFHDDKEYEASLMNYDEPSDIALLKINNAEYDKVFTYLKWAETPELGEDVIAIGSPMGQSFTVTFGNVSSLNRFIPNTAPYVPFIQTDAAINPGNSGGPLLNSHGDIIGMNTLIITGSRQRGSGSVGIVFAIDGSYVQKTVEQLKALPRGSKIQRPYMGIVFRPVKKEDMKNYIHGVGAYVEEVVKGSPAMGIIKVGDIILSMDGQPIKWKLLASLVKSKKIGDKAELIILRDGMEIPLTFEMGTMEE